VTSETGTTSGTGTAIGTGTASDTDTAGAVEVEPEQPATRQRLAGWWRRSPVAGSIRTGSACWLIAMLGAGVLTWLGRIVDTDPQGIAASRPIGPRAAIDTWAQWDWKYYGSIAHDGYAAIWPKNAAFFPSYPMLVRLADAVLPGPTIVAGLAVSSLALLGALIVLHRLVEREFDGAVAGRAVLFLLAFPTGFFLVAPYPTALFLLLLVGAFLAMRTGHWWIAGVLCGLASGTRTAGLLLVLPFAYEYLRQRRGLRLDALAILLAPTGLLAYMTYTYVRFGDALLFVRVQETWHRQLAPPWVSMARSVRAMWQFSLFVGQVNVLNFAAVCFVVAALVLAVVGPWRMRPDQLAFPIFGTAQLLLSISYPDLLGPDQSLMSASRFALEIFPAFLMAAVVGARLQWFTRAYVALGLLIEGTLVTYFLHGGWVA
jgi:hypothetical protein